MWTRWGAMKMQNKFTFITSLTLLTWLFISNSAFAHNVLGGAYAEDDLIEGEIGYSNGEMAKPGSVVEVFVNNDLIGTTETDEEGFFIWRAKFQK